MIAKNAEGVGNLIILQWLNDQLLKMRWLWDLVEVAVEKGFGLSLQSRLGASIHFFIYDVIKIFILLSALIFTISYLQSFFPPERTRKILGRHRGITGNISAGLLGAVTPFCSCSSIPLFIGFTNAGLPIGVTFSFLISSPLIDLASIILLAGIFNWKLAISYVAVGLILAVGGGIIISRLKLDDQVEAFVFGGQAADPEPVAPGGRARFHLARAAAWEIIKRVWPYIVIGVGVGAAIHNYIPEAIITAFLGQDKWYSVLLAAFVGIPMYADILGTLPIAEALVLKGVGIGTALSFMMGVTVLSLPSLIMLNKVIKPRLLLTFLGIVTAGIVVIGYLFNAFGYLII